jgi:anti-sigma factor RsiW
VSELRAPRLTCREIVELLTDYLEGALSEPARARVDAHLTTCPDCTAYVAQMRTTIGLLGRLREDDVPPSVLDELARAFRGWHDG